MKVTVVSDANGNIVAISKNEVLTPTNGVPSRVGLNARSGQRVLQLELPREFEQLPLAQIHSSAQLDIKGKEPKLVRKR
jgi:hypothetical protein